MSAAAKTELVPDLTAARMLFNELDQIHLVSILPDAPAHERPHGRGFGTDVLAAAGWAAQENAKGKNVYWTVNLVAPGLNKKPKEAEIKAARFGHVDIDPPKDGSPWSKSEALKSLRDHAQPPSFIVDSGNGLQAFWRLAEPIEQWDTVKEINDRLRHLFAGDNCHNIDRLMRVPGFVNWPNAKKRADGRVPALAHWIDPDDGVYYEPEELAAGLPPLPPSGETPRREAANDASDGWRLLTPDDLGLEAGSKVREAIERPKGKDRSGDGLSVARRMNNAGFSDAEILGILLNPANPVSAHYLQQTDPLRAAQRTVHFMHKSAKREGGSSPRNDSRPCIRLRPDALHLIATEAEAALIAGDAPLFNRSGVLMKPIVDDLPASHGQRAKVARMAEVRADSLLDYLSRCASWTKWDGRKEDWVLADPTRTAAQTILSRDGEWAFRKLAGVITSPTLRPDGSILKEDGYDESTRLLLCSPPSLPEIPERPSKTEALAALKVLDDLLHEFPFVDNASRSAALSALITPVVRGAMQVAPLHATTAPVAGSGKSYIIDLAAAISTGERAPVLAAGRTEEETEKRLGAALLNGQPIVSIDNVNGELGGDMLCQMIERPVVAIRPLGVSKLVKIESRATVFATGNNINLVGDMTRRVILCTLDPNVERPELRKFESNPFDAVLADRGKFIAAALIIARAYSVADRPGVLPDLASFEDWSRTVRSALVWLGCADPVETMEAARADDPTTANLRALLIAWREAAGSEPLTTGRIIERANERSTLTSERLAPDLFQAMCAVAENRPGDLNARRLGHFLSRHRGRIVGGLKFVDGEDSHAKQKVWAVVDA